MDSGILLVFQNYLGRGSDAETMRSQMHLADLAEPLGFGTVWPPEHHFTDYSACPDNIQFLTWLAGRTKRIRLGTGAVIVPWNDPLRVVEKMVMLDHLSEGRAVLGLGRGLSRTEYDHFGIAMDTSRDRFDEAARMILGALESGEIEGAGPYYPQPKTPIRPRPLASFAERFYCVGVSPESVEQAAALGGRLMTFSQQPWELYAKGALAQYRAAWERFQGTAPPAPLTGDLMFCDSDATRAEEKAREYMANYFLTIVDHYELMSEHFRHAKGYDFYATAADLFRAVGIEPAVQTYIDVQAWGTPEMILEKLRWRRELLGDFELTVIAEYGGMALETAEGSLRLFAEKVLPELKKW